MKIIHEAPERFVEAFDYEYETEPDLAYDSLMRHYTSPYIIHNIGVIVNKLI